MHKETQTQIKCDIFICGPLTAQINMASRCHRKMALITIRMMGVLVGEITLKRGTMGRQNGGLTAKRGLQL